MHPVIRHLFLMLQSTFDVSYGFLQIRDGAADCYLSFHSAFKTSQQRLFAGHSLDEI